LGYSKIGANDDENKQEIYEAAHHNPFANLREIFFFFDSKTAVIIHPLFACPLGWEIDELAISRCAWVGGSDAILLTHTTSRFRTSRVSLWRRSPRLF
jgi:hypothetical protein